MRSCRKRGLTRPSIVTCLSVLILPVRFAVTAALADAVSPVAIATQLDRDLSNAMPAAKNVCEAVGTYYGQHDLRSLLLNELPESRWAKTVNLAGVHRLMTNRGWGEAVQGDYGMTHYSGQGFGISSINLFPGRPAALIFFTSVGSLHNPLLWVFAPTPNGAMANHLLLHLGFEGSGPFDTAFVRFHGTPFAVMLSNGDSGPYTSVYALDPTKLICGFEPPA